jgi:hypothetical protein
MRIDRLRIGRPWMRSRSGSGNAGPTESGSTTLVFHRVDLDAFGTTGYINFLRMCRAALWAARGVFLDPNLNRSIVRQHAIQVNI